MVRKIKKALAVRLGKRIRRMRLMRKLTQTELGELAGGMDQKYIGVIERGEQNVTVETAAKIAAALDFPLKDLLDVKTTVKEAEDDYARRLTVLFKRLSPSKKRLLYSVAKTTAREVQRRQKAPKKSRPASFRAKRRAK